MNDLEEALDLLADLVDFVELPNIQASIDGCQDPDVMIARAKKLVEDNKNKNNISKLFDLTDMPF